MLRAVIVLLLALPSAAVASGGETWGIAILSGGDEELERGAVLALEEAERTWALLGRSLERPGSSERADAVVRGGDEVSVHFTADPAGPWVVSRPERCRAAHAGAVDWDPSFDRYGAEQLNERFLRRWDAPMTERAWYGWMAVKIAAEAGLSEERPEELGFDGHKGRRLELDPETRRLVHPAFRREAGRWVEVE